MKIKTTWNELYTLLAHAEISLRKDYKLFNNEKDLMLTNTAKDLQYELIKFREEFINIEGAPF